MANPVTCGIICGPVEGSFIETNNPQVGMGHCLGGSNLMLEIYVFFCLRDIPARIVQMTFGLVSYDDPKVTPLITGPNTG